MLCQFDPRYQYCTRIKKDVYVCRSEAVCRKEHGCTKSNCPLWNVLGLGAFDRRMRAFSTVYDLWPLGGGPAPDFP
jgi:hypothetical protein